MTKWFNLGVSDPLTLGMASPYKGHLADRLEILARKKRTTKLSRTIAGSVLLGAAALSAPMTIADSHPEGAVKTKSVFMFSDGAVWSDDGQTKLRSGGAYEIVTEDGELKAYKITNGGETREEVAVSQTEDGVYELILQNGEVVTFEEPDLSGLDGLDALDSLEGLEGLKGLDSLGGLSALSKLGNLSELSELGKLGEMDFPDGFIDGEVKIIINDDARILFEGDEESRATLREKIQSAMKNGNAAKELRFFTDKGHRSVYRFSEDEGFEFPEFDGENLPDTVIHFGDGGLRVERPLESATRQLDRTEKQLERMIEEDGEVSRELKQAMRDLAKARKSLEKARADMEASK